MKIGTTWIWPRPCTIVSNTFPTELSCHTERDCPTLLVLGSKWVYCWLPDYGDTNFPSLVKYISFKHIITECFHKIMYWCGICYFDFSKSKSHIEVSLLFQGYTIPLDKRLAADGRGLQGVHINENFAKLAEALYIADRKVWYRIYEWRSYEIY